MKFVIKHPTKDVYLRKPRYVGDTVQWTVPRGEPLSVREPWVFATRAGAEKARDMNALEASVEMWYEAGDAAQSEPKATHYSPSNSQNYTSCPPAYVIPAPQDNSYLLSAVLAELIIVSSSDCSGF